MKLCCPLDKLDVGCWILDVRYFVLRNNARYWQLDAPTAQPPLQSIKNSAKSSVQHLVSSV